MIFSTSKALSDRCRPLTPHAPRCTETRSCFRGCLLGESMTRLKSLVRDVIKPTRVPRSSHENREAGRTIPCEKEARMSIERRFTPWTSENSVRRLVKQFAFVLACLLLAGPRVLADDAQTGPSLPMNRQ